jgi:hypothetical protein
MLPLLRRIFSSQDHLLAGSTHPAETISETMHLPQLLLPLLGSRLSGVSTSCGVIQQIPVPSSPAGRAGAPTVGLLLVATGADCLKESTDWAERSVI